MRIRFAASVAADGGARRAAPGPGRALSLLLVSTLLLASACMVAPARGVRFARIVGATEVVRVEEAGLDFVARVDTGARSSSLHAVELEIEDPAPRVEDNVGRRIHFRVINERGESARLSSVIVDIVGVRQALGTELRYAVPLHLTWQGIRRQLRVNLRDRSSIDHKLLVGRDWIGRGFLVDVKRNPAE
jgi:hypothetical protein